MAQAARPQPEHVYYQRVAWTWLLVFFALFCVLVAVAGYGGWQYYATAMNPLEGSVLRSHVNAGVSIQPRGRLVAESIERLPPERDPCPGELDICATVAEGSVIRTKSEAGYGPVASLVLADRTQIDFWAHPAGAELALISYRTTAWHNGRLEAFMRQNAGYLRYDIAAGQPYDQVDYVVDVGDGTRVRLTPGGSYSINVLTGASRAVSAPAVTGEPIRVEVATRAGSAIIEHRGDTVEVQPGQLVQIDAAGALVGPGEARWELIRDGGFEQYADQNRYDQTSKTWRKYALPNAPGMAPEEHNGRFTVVRSCRPETPDFCTPDDQVSIGQFRRDGLQTRPFTVGIEQTIDADVSEFPSLRLSMWVRVLTQTVQLAGVAGSECPVMVRITYKPTSPTDQEANRYFCIYTGSGEVSNSEDAGEIRYRQVPQFQWYRLNVELRDDALLRQARYIQSIRIEARGHDYLSEVTGISLIGRQ